MPIINAQGKLFRIWEGLLNACRAQAARLPNIEPLQTTMQEILDRARIVKGLQEDNTAQRQALTQELSKLIENGHETARRLRGYAKSQLGTKNEMLVQFGAAPIRSAARAAKQNRAAAKAASQLPVSDL
jgi:hypothetical protein